MRGLRAGFWLKRRVDSARFTKVDFIPPNNYIYSFYVRSPEDLDGEVRAWLLEALSRRRSGASDRRRCREALNIPAAT